VITALNEEAVAEAALGNKGGINIIVTYEAFAAKMLGAVRQEIIFAGNGNAAGRPPGWLSVPLVLTSHTWENGKNELSHQDPSLAEVLLGEPANVSRVVFPADYNSAAAAIYALYQTQGQIWKMVVPKSSFIPDLFTAEEATRVVTDGGLRLAWAGYQASDARVILSAVGAYQLVETLRASSRLAEREVPHAVNYLFELGRFREPRGPREAAHMAGDDVRSHLFPADVPARVFLSHTRPATLLGVLHPLTATGHTIGLGFVNQGGTLDTPGMLFVNRASWAHAIDGVARLLGLERGGLLTEEEQAVLDGRIPPQPALA
jgi:phosphoketolase